MTHREFLRWIALETLECPGEKDVNWQLAAIGASICNALAGAFGGEKIEADFFMPSRDGPEPPVGDQVREWEAFVRMHNRARREKGDL